MSWWREILWSIDRVKNKGHSSCRNVILIFQIWNLKTRESELLAKVKWEVCEVIAILHFLISILVLFSPHHIDFGHCNLQKHFLNMEKIVLNNHILKLSYHLRTYCIQIQSHIWAKYMHTCSYIHNFPSQLASNSFAGYNTNNYKMERKPFLKVPV